MMNRGINWKTTLDSRPIHAGPWSKGIVAAVVGTIRSTVNQFSLFEKTLRSVAAKLNKGLSPVQRKKGSKTQLRRKRFERKVMSWASRCADSGHFPFAGELPRKMKKAWAGTRSRVSECRACGSGWHPDPLMMSGRFCDCDDVHCSCPMCPACGGMMGLDTWWKLDELGIPEERRETDSKIVKFAWDMVKRDRRAGR